MRTVILICLSWFTAVAGAEPPRNPRCEWESNPKVVRDPCPEFYWECAGQHHYRLMVATAPDGFAQPWWQVTRTNRLPILEYAGPPLRNGATYYWKLRVWDTGDHVAGESPVQQFTFHHQPMPHFLPTARTFVNFAGNPAWAKDKIDLCFRRDAKQGRRDILATQYALICTMVVPSRKADDLRRFCEQRGYNFEDCFCHFAQDTQVTLHVGAERASNPREQRACPGWDPRNDRNGDGRIDEAEFGSRQNSRATARERRQARIPIYYWGPPQDDFVMNVGHPGYQEFMATVYAAQMVEGYDGLYFDTVPTDVAGVGRNSAVVEYPRQGDNADQWRRDMQLLFARLKSHLPGKLITANGWAAEPMVIEGFQAENWLNITVQRSAWERVIADALSCDRRGKMQLLQYNPIYDEKLAEFGRKVPGVTPERDRLYGLASYYLIHGDYTYFGFGSHPYAKVTEQWFKAIERDIGKPKGVCHLWSETEHASVEGGTNLLSNGGFEAQAGWRLAPPIEIDTSERHSGKSSIRITSDSPQINNINSQSVTLRPHTTYTLTAWLKTSQVTGSPGAQVYPYEFSDATGASLQITVTGTTGWTRHRQMFTTGADTTGRISFRMYGATGTAWFDDLELVEGTRFTHAIYAREFSRGLVLVKPYIGGSYGDETSFAVKLRRTLRPLNSDGSSGGATSSITLRNGEATILLEP